MSDSKSLRSEINQVFEDSKEVRQAMFDYSTKLLALSVEYHRTAIQEKLGLETKSGIVVATLDVRQTPASLERTLDELKKSGVEISGAIHDMQEAKIYLYKV